MSLKNVIIRIKIFEIFFLKDFVSKKNNFDFDIQTN